MLTEPAEGEEFAKQAVEADPKNPEFTTFSGVFCWQPTTSGRVLET